MEHKVKLRIEEITHNDFAYLVECMEGDKPVDRIVTESELYDWLAETNYCMSGYHDDMGEWIERPVPINHFMLDADMYKVLADYLNAKEQRTLRLPVQPKPLPSDALLPTLAASHFMSTINRPQSKRA